MRPGAAGRPFCSNPSISEMPTNGTNVTADGSLVVLRVITHSLHPHNLTLMPTLIVPRHTPLLLLLNLVPESLARIAPERVDEMMDKFRALQFSMNDEPGLGFFAREGKINLPLRGLEFLWALSHFMWELKTVNATSVGAVITFRDHPSLVTAARLLKWAIGNELSRGTPLEWPASAPRPATTVARPSGAAWSSTETDELFFCSTAWILHHELAHISLNHQSHSARSVQEERDADWTATALILDGAPDEQALHKRALGIATAVVAFAALDSSAGAQPRAVRTHPLPSERIHAALGHARLGEDHEAQYIASLAIRTFMYFDSEEEQSVVGCSTLEALAEDCVTLHRYLVRLQAGDS